MEFLSAMFGLVPCLYDHTSKETLYIRHLKKNLEDLSKKLENLKNLYEDVKARVERAEDGQMMRKKQVGGWIREVEDMIKEIEEIRRRGEQEIHKRCLKGCCPSLNCWSRYDIGKQVSEKLVEVSDQLSSGNFDVVAEMLPRPRVDELPMEETFGLESVYETVCGFLKDPQVGIIGIYGMGGVGKTTLTKKINNHFLTTSTDFDIVIWATVSKPSNIVKIQEDIRKKLQIPLDIWETKTSKEEKATEIFRVLKTKKFVLLLDDIWERLGLLEMGVPCTTTGSENKSKIVFTTRSREVCNQMKAQKRIEVLCLSSETAWDLFQKEVGEETLNSHPHVPRLARVVAEECKGLPLALKILGRAMAGEKDPSNWDKVIQDLRNFPAEISGMEDELFHRLKASYDRLPDNVIKSCFTYCSLYPEDWQFSTFDLPGQWIGEGFLGEVHDIHEARDHGYKIIKKLKDACLLECCDEIEDIIKMHDITRDMALWLYHDGGKERNKVLVLNDFSRLINAAEEVSKLKETERIFLSATNVENFPETFTLMCPNLKTFIMDGCRNLNKLPIGFFQFTPLLRVLSLSHNYNLNELPAEIGNLAALRFLDLSRTRIRELPIQLKNLKHLMILVLVGMRYLKSIPPHVISSLESLKCLTILDSINLLSGAEEKLLDELESLNGISDIGMIISTTLSFNKLKSSHKLGRCISILDLHELKDVISLELSSFLKRANHLVSLSFRGCDQLKDVKFDMEKREAGTHSDPTLPNYLSIKEEYFHSLRYIEITECSKLLSLTWLAHVPYIEYLEVTNCESIEEVICGGAVEKLDIFLRLKYLVLRNLPRLKSIYLHPLLLPSLQIIDVNDCESLRSLPFDANTSNKNLKKIEGEKNWWDQLEWMDEAIKHSFAPYYVSSDMDG